MAAIARGLPWQRQRTRLAEPMSAAPQPRQITIPSHRTFKTDAFEAWLLSGGAEKLASTNPYELVRWRDPVGVRVLYRNAKGRITANGDAAVCVSDYLAGRPYPWRQRRGVALFYGQRRQLVEAVLDRDGDDCFFCGRPMGDDVTIEHLVPKNSGGPDHAANIVLAHRACNHAAGHLHVVGKIGLRDALKSKAMLAEALDVLHGPMVS